MFTMLITGKDIPILKKHGFYFWSDDQIEDLSSNEFGEIEFSTKERRDKAENFLTEYYK